jgi:glycosyltransferase involved in cell wall biosynthesis
MPSPIFSIIIPTYNSAKTLEVSLQSIANQTFSNLEVIVMDGASTDRTVAIAQEYVSSIPRMQIYSEKDNGIYDAMNKAIAKATGEWLFFMGSDDSFYAETVLEQIANEIPISEIDAIYGDVYSDRFNGRYAGEFTVDKLIKQNICHQALFMHRRLFDKIGTFNLKYKSHADWDHNIRWFFRSSIRKKYVDIVVANYADGGYSSMNFDKAFHKVRPYKCLYLGFTKLSRKSVKKLIKQILGYA